MAKRALPCPTVLRQLLRYEPETGKLFWKPRARIWFKSERAFAIWNARYPGTPALSSIDRNGYGIGAILKDRHARSHVVAWAITTGSYPKGHIDHINGVRDDNRIENLRDVSRTENQRNLRMNRNNKSGQMGVYWLERCSRWWAFISSGNARISLGYYENLDDAISARKSAEIDLGYHPNHGR
ncbi:MAG: HNH endonuclease signature motif containing protein [Paracoccaceae bacterium]